MLAERQAQLGMQDRNVGATGYMSGTTALRIKKSPSMETNTGVPGTSVSDLIADRNEQWGGANINE